MLICSVQRRARRRRVYKNPPKANLSRYPPPRPCKFQVQLSSPRSSRSPRSRITSTPHRTHSPASLSDLPSTLPRLCATLTCPHHSPASGLSLADTPTATGPTLSFSCHHHSTTTTTPTRCLPRCSCPTRPASLLFPLRRARTSLNPSATHAQIIPVPPLPAHPSRKALGPVPARRSMVAGCAKSPLTGHPPSERSAISPRYKPELTVSRAASPRPHRRKRCAHAPKARPFLTRLCSVRV